MRFDLPVLQKLRIELPKLHTHLIMLRDDGPVGSGLAERLSERGICQYPAHVDVFPLRGPAVRGQERQAVELLAVVARKSGGIDPERGVYRDAVEDMAQGVVGEVADLAAAVWVAVVEDGSRAVGFDEGEVGFARGGDDGQTGPGMVVSGSGAEGNGGGKRLTVRRIVSPLCRMPYSLR